ncbi:MAG: hypothetical protein ABL866_02620 [Devosia sp.]
MRGTAVALIALALVSVPVVAQDMSKSSSEEAVTLSSSEASSSTETASSSVDSPDMSRSSATSSEPSSDELPSEAVPVGPEIVPVPALEMLQTVFDVCVDVASGDPEALDRAWGAGWQPGDEEYGGPFRSIHSGYRDFDGYEGTSFRALTDSFPTQRLGYCSGSIGDSAERIDLNLFASVAGLVGKTIAAEGGIYGAWETRDHRVMVFAGHAEGYVDYEINILLGPAPAP